MSRHTRRKFLQKGTVAGIALASIGVGNVTAKQDDRSYSAAIREAQMALMNSRVPDDISDREDNPANTDTDDEGIIGILDEEEEPKEKAEAILDEFDIKHNHSKESLDLAEISLPEFTPDSRFGNPDEESDTAVHIDLYANDDYDNKTVIDAWMSFELYEKGGINDLANPCPPDGAAIYWEDQDTYTELEPDARDNFKDPWVIGGLDTNLAEEPEIEFEERDITGGGLLGQITNQSLPNEGNEGYMYGGFLTRVEVVGDETEDHPIYSKYKHHYNPLPTGCYGGADLSLNAGTISLSSDMKSWKMSTYEKFD